ncbi:DUF2620 family protein [Xylanimonas ulmi]|uniref:Uncharacterized protein DUF2620 n=1 Tax=Xylanimonas ulmi TaxID=228973 RepID=A0A4Q7M5Q0_9MICO|nr:DUF2620 family protein [Xylanibacterium ulmi]RZS62373.1 uncharacterized protein DUF2620 [Xylanibacterium ulmi]
MRIIAGGVGKAQVADALRSMLRPHDTITVSSDMDAALKLRTGDADYYLGTCHTGAGASLGVLVGLLGADKCHTFGRAALTAEDIEAQLSAGKVAFGFSVDQIDDAVPALWAALLKEEKV